MAARRKIVIRRSTIIHVIVWGIFFSLPYIFSPPDAKKEPQYNAFHGFITTTTAVWMGLFYLNANVLVSRFLYRKKYWLYLLLNIAVFFILWPLFKLFFTLFNFPFTFELYKIIPGFLVTVMISTTYKTIYDRIQAEELATEKQKENLKTELSFLRSQINPHFIFNVLNNIVSLVRLKSDQLEPTILKLSSLMQYMLYETDEEKVSLPDEANYVESYIDLQKMRFSSRVKIKASFNVNEDNTYFIEPMLLIPFVENAFKHGVGIIEDPFINITLYVEGSMLHFSVENKYNVANTSKDKTSGIGLANVSRRLQLLYGKEHTLTVTTNDGIYKVVLQIKLK